MFEQGMIIQNRYEIIEEVGSGGMSVVYKAKCHVLNRFVAIKVLKPEFSDDKSFVSKFRVEAQSAAGLSHPNIVNVFDVGEENGYYYIVMELVEGITLKEYIQQNGRLPYQTALDFIMQICAGIEVAHEHHTIHRDIKPQNIIVSKNGTLKVTDFGIAKAATSNTIASSAMGSVHYISPEQARGGYSDERSDIYSLGITLYEMLTGRVPFEGENNVTVALMHIQSEIIPPREYYPDIPIGVERIVLKATQKKPERRYLTTNAMLADLRKVAMDPNADVGNTNGVMANNAPTIQISEEELAAIKSAAPVDEGISIFPVNKPNPELEEANRALESLYGDDDEIYDDEETLFDEEDEDEDEKSGLEPKMEKIITIGAIAATVIIAIIIIVAIASVTGMFKKAPATTELAVTTEEAKVKMIDVVGLKEEDAVAALDNEEIAYRIEREHSDTFEAGTVMSQSVDEGEEIKDGERVTIVISNGKEEETVPDVVGKTLAEAKAALEALGFTVEEDEEYDDEVEEGKVISQTPEGNEKTAKGGQVTIVVSKGKEVKVAVVPDVRNMTITEAEAALSAVNLKLGNVTHAYDDNVEDGRVIAQSIANGTEVKEETAVDITISKGTEPKTTTYTASFSGAISNVSYNFEEGESVYITLTLKVGEASYTIIADYYTEGALPVRLSDANTITGLASQNATLVYSVKDESGADITGSFKSSVKAKLSAVEQ
ncbi:MAG: Stk1 family PASTA domain-containing Ser/Thr kinase [Bacteroidales bacterium]|nr:Stk1 family PASTA domain-containing Ser/Thr kinase [Clostridium sp.]MCM1202669.1 Stk1 family PASTA domain-containing Ser/Thr kinase [Bacteroidales bacterium]